MEEEKIDKLLRLIAKDRIRFVLNYPSFPEKGFGDIIIKNIAEERLDCYECTASGTIYIDTTRECRVPMNECCGGCGYEIDCTECGGEGIIWEEID